ncbi:FAD-binding protein [Luteolibacter marinus]|uniref:FAD-binding protein n=1 Tax=Luteolibacter marinus TaxID=2776705 RepID=UPI001D02C1C8|nr:FAD-binding protein [Luteolibacter marinus]
MAPDQAAEVADAVRAYPRVAAVGGGSKRRLVGAGEEISLRGLTGILEYHASEFTFTARAGTPVAEVAAALAEEGQYLPFDPLFVAAGATLGGTVAAGISGPGRFRFGGLRDFLIGVQFVDGRGELIRGGGKVVKNAAGFDLPKFLVGSMGRFGIVTEVCFKVFPAPVASLTLKVACADAGVAVERMVTVGSSRWEADAMEYLPQDSAVWLRLGGPEVALEKMAREIAACWPGEVEIVAAGEADRFWADAREVIWADGAPLVKVPLTLSRIADLEARLRELGPMPRRYSAGAAGWFACPDETALDAMLAAQGSRGLAIRGGGGSSPWLGSCPSPEVARAVKSALDPDGRFPSP